VSGNFTTAFFSPLARCPLVGRPSSGIRYSEGTADRNHYLSKANLDLLFRHQKNCRFTGNLTSCLLRYDPLRRRHYNGSSTRRRG